MFLRLSRKNFDQDFNSFMKRAEAFKEEDYSFCIKQSDKKEFDQIPSEIELIISIKLKELERLQMQYVGCVDGICTYNFTPVLENHHLDDIITRFITYIC